ncbi:MAG: hypothetical protein A2X78_01310 [Gammaproteobacteria bacterium GWE2_37_16]|nr:MAG: hypothetical protein A2X78_01310 [Gammaproteobacteria bacterium GWE2_37_16]
MINSADQTSHILHAFYNELILSFPFAGKIYIQPHDRLIVVEPVENASAVEIQRACQYLRENIGGKIFVLSNENSGLGFINHFENNENPSLNRIRAVVPQVLLDYTAMPASDTIRTLDGEPARSCILSHRAEIIRLMENSGFSREKIADYLRKGEEGLDVLMHGSHPIVSIENGHLVGFCNLSTIGTNVSYISDTVTVPGRREELTRHLYNRAAGIAKEKGFIEIKIIVPGGREDEFTSYGFDKHHSRAMYVSLTESKPEMDELYRKFLQFTREQKNWLSQFEVTANNELRVQLSTSYLDIRSISEEDRASCYSLFANNEARKYYGSGLPLLTAQVEPIFNMWKDRWLKNNPYSAFSIYTKNHEFVGIISIGTTNQEGLTETACLLLPQFINGDCATEAMSMLVNRYLPEITRLEYRIKYSKRNPADLNGPRLEGSVPLQKVRSTAWESDTAIQIALERSGLAPNMQSGQKESMLDECYICQAASPPDPYHLEFYPLTAYVKIQSENRLFYIDRRSDAQQQVVELTAQTNFAQFDSNVQFHTIPIVGRDKPRKLNTQELDAIGNITNHRKHGIKKFTYQTDLPRLQARLREEAIAAHSRLVNASSSSLAAGLFSPPVSPQSQQLTGSQSPSFTFK